MSLPIFQHRLIDLRQIQPFIFLVHKFIIKFPQIEDPKIRELVKRQKKAFPLLFAGFYTKNKTSSFLIRSACPAPTTRPASAPMQKQLLKQDRKSTRLNSSHVAISYAVFCLK